MNLRKQVSVLVLLVLVYCCFFFQHLSPDFVSLKEISTMHEDYCNEYSNFQNIASSVGDPSQSEIDNALDQISKYKNLNYDIGIDSYIENENTTTEQKEKAKNAILNIFIAWFVAGGATLFLSSCIACCFRENCCDKKCDILRAQDFKGMICSVFCSLLFNTAICGIGISCLIITVDKPYKNMRCLSTEIFYEVSEGSEDWVGFKQFIDDVSVIGTNFNSIFNETKQLAQNITLQVESITSDYDELIKQNQELGGMLEQDSFYQQNQILAYISNGTNISNDQIFKEAENLQISPQNNLFETFYQNITESILKIKKYCQILIDDGNQLNQSLTNGRSQSDLINQGIEIASNNLNTLIQDWDETKNTLALYNLIYFAVLAGLSFLILVASMCLCFDKCILFSKLTYQGIWVVYFLLVLVAFAASGLFQTQIVILVEGYDHFDGITVDQIKFNQITRLLPDKYLKDFLSQCLFYGGNVAQILEMNSLDSIQNLYNSVNEFKKESSQYQILSLKLNESLQINSDYINTFVNFTRVDEKEPNQINDTGEIANVKYLMRTSVKECNNKQNNSVPDNMTYCEKDSYKFDPSVDLDKDFTPLTDQPICFQSATFYSNRSLIAQYIPNCKVLQTIDKKQQTQTKQWLKASKQEQLIIEKYKNITDPLTEYVEMINKYISKYDYQFSTFNDPQAGLAVIKNQHCGGFSITIDRVRLGFYKLIAFYRILWILNVTIACLLFFNLIWMFRVIMNIYYIQPKIDSSKNEYYGQSDLPH